MGTLRLLLWVVLAVVAVSAALAQTAELPVAWEYPTPGVLPQAILRDAKGRECLYVALKNGGLTILGISGGQVARTRLASIPTKSLGGLDVMQLAQQNDLLYLALGDFFSARGAPAGLAVVSVADLAEPRVLSLWQSEQALQGAAAITVRGRYAYLGAMDHGVFVFDVSDPAKIHRVAQILPDMDFPRKDPGRVQRPNARGLAIQKQFLYVAFDAGGLRVIDIANPLRPQEVGRYINNGMGQKQQAYNNVVIDGSMAYVAIDYAGLEVLDISDPGHIRQVAWWNPWKADSMQNLWFNSPGHTNQIALDKARRLVYLSAGDSELLVVDISAPANPKLVSRYGAIKDGLGAWGVALDDRCAYLGYITAAVPFRGNWSGIKAVRR